MDLGLVSLVVGKGDEGDVDVATVVGEGKVGICLDAVGLEDDAVVDSL
jgi:hypothetical protein